MCLPECKAAPGLNYKSWVGERPRRLIKILLNTSSAKLTCTLACKGALSNDFEVDGKPQTPETPSLAWPASTLVSSGHCDFVYLLGNISPSFSARGFRENGGTPPRHCFPGLHSPKPGHTTLLKRARRSVYTTHSKETRFWYLD